MAPVDPQHNAHQPRLSRPESAHQLALPGDPHAVDQQAAQALPPAVGADIHMAHQAGAGLLIVGRDGILHHPVFHRPPQAGGRLALEQAVLHIHHLVGAGLVESDAGAGGDGKLGLVAVAVRPGGPQNFRHMDIRAPQTAEAVLHPGALGLQLLGVGDVPEGAAAAAVVIGTVGGDPGRGGFGDLPHHAPQGGAAHVGEPHLAQLAPDTALDEHHHAVQPGHAGAVAAVALDAQGIGMAFQMLIGLHTYSRPSAYHREW